MKKLKRNIAVILAACLVCSLLSGFIVSGVNGSAAARAMSLSPYARLTVYIDGILTDTVCFGVNSTPYMSMERFCQALGVEYTELAQGEGEAVRAEIMDMTVSVPDSCQYISANGRYFRISGGLRVMRGEQCLPVAELCRLVGAGLYWDSDSRIIDIDGTYLRGLRAAEDYYNELDLTWLARIIEAEAVGEVLDGKIGVGNVVLNRAASGSFPDNVYDVIFDTRYGIQFSPVETGSIYNEPTEQSVIAAKICLEGYRSVGESLYFVNPDLGISSWFRETRTFVATIGDHDFYA